LWLAIQIAAEHFLNCTKIDQLIFRKILIKTVATRCQILRPKCTKFDFGRGFAQTLLGGRGVATYSAHKPLAVFKGPISKKRRKERDRSGKGEGNREVRAENIRGATSHCTV